jgi:hypothetical protein
MIPGAEVSVPRTDIFHHCPPSIGADAATHAAAEAAQPPVVFPSLFFTTTLLFNRFNSSNHFSESFSIRPAGYSLWVKVCAAGYVYCASASNATKMAFYISRWLGHDLQDC